MIAPDWLLYLGAGVLVLIALRLAGAFSRRGSMGALQVNVEKQSPEKDAPPPGKKKSRPRRGG